MAAMTRSGLDRAESPGMSSLELLQRAIDQLAGLIASVRPEQTSLRTPCSDWDLRQLVNHVVFDLSTFEAGLRGTERGAPDADLIDDDWPVAYRAAADGLMHAWQSRGTEGTLHTQMGDLPLTWALGQHVADLAVHGWDVARAVDRPIDQLDTEVGEAALAFLRSSLKPEYRGQAFGPEVTVPDSAPVYERLAAFSGRSVT
jgi:uncharacterized protein (TIGR03086 family)